MNSSQPPVAAQGTLGSATITPKKVREQRDIWRQLKATLSRDIRLMRRHRDGLHKKKEATCDLCMERVSDLASRVQKLRER